MKLGGNICCWRRGDAKPINSARQPLPIPDSLLTDTSPSASHPFLFVIFHTHSVLTHFNLTHLWQTPPLPPSIASRSSVTTLPPPSWPLSSRPLTDSQQASLHTLNAWLYFVTTNRADQTIVLQSLTYELTYFNLRKTLVYCLTESKEWKNHSSVYKLTSKEFFLSY